MGSVIILIIALVWFMAIIGLKIAGQKRVGFLAGRLENTEASNLATSGGVEVVMENEEYAHGEKGEGFDKSVAAQKNDGEVDKRFKKKVWAVRAAFVISGICVITCAGLFYGKGVVSFKK